MTAQGAELSRFSIANGAMLIKLARYTHTAEEQKLGALQSPCVVTNSAQRDEAADDESSTASDIAE